jgi:anaphase-promoting complex subunit 5
MSKPRYLTASKISLLVLVQLYCDSDFPSSATVPVLSFVLSHTYPTTPSAARKPHGAEQHVALSVRTFEDILQDHTSSMPGRSLLDDFLKCLWEMNSIDSLFDLFSDLGNLLGPSKEEPSHETKRMHLSPTSPLGAFIRQARLEFTRLPFDDIVHLWCAFVGYRAPTAQWARRLSGLASPSVDIVTTDLGLGKDDSLFEISYGRLLEGNTSSTSLSHDDLERILEFQLDKLQRMYTCKDESSPTNNW